MLSCVCAANTLLFSLSFLFPSPPVLIISHWNYYNLIRYHPSSRPSLAPHCKPTAIIRRVCSLRRRVISRLIYIYPRILLFVARSRTSITFLRHAYLILPSPSGAPVGIRICRFASTCLCRIVRPDFPSRKDFELPADYVTGQFVMWNEGERRAASYRGNWKNWRGIEDDF